MSKPNLNRRNFIFSTATGLAGTLLPAASVLAAEDSELRNFRKENEHCFLTKPYLQAPSVNSMAIMWITNKPCLNWVEYGETEKLGAEAKQVTGGLVNTHDRVNKIQLKKLKAATKYFYRVCSKEIVDFQPYKMTYGETIYSDVFSFTTISTAAENVSWLVLNDIHDRPNSFGELIKLNGNDPYDFVFLNGDMFDYQTDEKQIIDHLLEPCNFFSAEKPFLFVRGNHETRGKFSRNLPAYYCNYNNSEYYSFQWGPVFAIVLDTGEDKPDSHPVYAGAVDFDAYRQEQALWMEQQMQTREYRKAKFRVVMMHIPHLHSDDWHGTTHCNKLFGPLFEKHKIDLFVAGHTHKYAMHAPEKDKHSYHMAIGGGPQAGKRTLTKIAADRKMLTLQMLKDDGTVIGKFTIPSKR